MKLHDYDCKVAQIYFLDEHGLFNKHAVFINMDKGYKSLNLISKISKGEKNSITTIKEMKGCYYAD